VDEYPAQFAAFLLPNAGIFDDLANLLIEDSLLAFPETPDSSFKGA
jgi:hypothetical protein